MTSACPNCTAPGMRPFYEARSIPVHSCMMCADERTARNFPQGDLRLGFCSSCGFVSNLRFDASLQHYAAGYEEQQSYSPRFRRFQTDLIEGLIDRYALRDKDVVEIGCGKGDFLVELCAAGENRGLGIDPACDPERMAGSGADRVRFIAELYDERHADVPCDFLCCRHTLEHIQSTNAFVAHLRRVIGDNREARVFFEVPDVRRVLRERAFWDIYYEHCSYFSLGSLARVFRRNAFDVLELAQDYDDQYLLLVAQPAAAGTPASLPQEDDLAQVTREVDDFEGEVGRRIEGFRQRVRNLRVAGQRVAIWGSGSKCVSFLSTVGVADDIAAVVDINPHRHGKFLAGSGREVIAPEGLVALQPGAILVMNPIYLGEIREQLRQMGLAAELIPC